MLGPPSAELSLSSSTSESELEELGSISGLLFFTCFEVCFFDFSFSVGFRAEDLVFCGAGSGEDEDSWPLLSLSVIISLLSEGAIFVFESLKWRYARDIGGAGNRE